jgi:hypothetical protein
MRANIWLLVLLGGCDSYNGVGGEEWYATGSEQADAEINAEPPSDLAEVPTILAGHAWCSGAAETSFDAIGDTGEIWVMHAGFDASCCMSYDIAVAADGANLNVTYTGSGEACDCTCEGFSIEYVITGVTPGDWTVNAEDQVSSVTVR